MAESGTNGINRVPQYVIDSSSVNVFKNRPDETWGDMGIYSWEATSPINLVTFLSLIQRC